MKKIILAATMVMAATAASALEMGVSASRDYSGPTNRDGYGVTLSHQMGKNSLTLGYDRFTSGANDQDRLSLVAGHDMAKLGAVTIAPKVGVAHLNNQTGADGYAMTVGVGATLPVAKRLSLTVDFSRQYGQDRVKAFDGNRVTIGTKYSF